MKKSLAYWGDFAFLPLYLMVTYLAFPTLYNNAVWSIGYCLIFMLVALVLLVRDCMRKQYAVRNWSYLIFGLFALMFVVTVFAFRRLMGPEYLAGDSARAELFWWLVRQISNWFEIAAISLYSARIAIWIYKGRQAKKAEANHDTKG